jgi:hypothetical protein
VSEPAQLPVFTTGVPDDIYAFHRSTVRSSNLYRPQARQYQKHFPG